MKRQETWEQMQVRQDVQNREWLNGKCLPRDLEAFARDRAKYFKQELEKEREINGDNLTRVWLITGFNRWTRFVNMLKKEKTQ